MTHIIILNWNGGNDTWLCLERVLPLPDARITLFDNNSSDESIAYIKAQLGAQGLTFNEMAYAALKRPSDGLSAKLTIVAAPENLGFAKAVNSVLQTLLSKSDVDYIWLLNNDALAAKETLTQLINTLKSSPGLGFAGSLILDANTQTEVIQCAGVKYYRWLGVSKMLWKNTELDSLPKDFNQLATSTFQHGASLLVSMDAVRTIGLMDERFFLYSEEHDWQVRGLQHGFGNCLCAGSIVHHKGSMSTDSSKHLFFYYYCKSSVLFSRKHHPGINAMIASGALLMITVLRTKLKHKSLQWALKGMREAWRMQL